MDGFDIALGLGLLLADTLLSFEVASEGQPRRRLVALACFLAYLFIGDMVHSFVCRVLL
jgi:hypothetical protein